MRNSLYRQIRKLIRPYDRCPSLRVLLENFETTGAILRIAPKNVRRFSGISRQILTRFFRTCIFKQRNSHIINTQVSLKCLLRDAFDSPESENTKSMCFKVIKELSSTEDLIEEIFPPEELDYLARAHQSFDDFYAKILQYTTSNEELKAALALLEKGHDKARDKEINSAIKHYQTSISLFPTSDAFSYLGFMLAQNSKLPEALDMYHAAIEVDDTFGNPYNDIGVIFMNTNRTSESLEWFEKAKWRPRSDARQHPYVNLGKLFASRGDTRSALREFVAATHFNPTNETLRKATLSCWDTLRGV
jgi:tetratricopeptide (TPR) repeat protein